MSAREIAREMGKTQELFNKGFKVLRLWEQEIKRLSLEDFKNQIKSNLNVKEVKWAK